MAALARWGGCAYLCERGIADLDDVQRTLSFETGPAADVVRSDRPACRPRRRPRDGRGRGEAAAGHHHQRHGPAGLAAGHPRSAADAAGQDPVRVLRGEAPATASCSRRRATRPPSWRSASTSTSCAPRSRSPTPATTTACWRLWGDAPHSFGETTAPSRSPTRGLRRSAFASWPRRGSLPTSPRRRMAKRWPPMTTTHTASRWACPRAARTTRSATRSRTRPTSISCMASPSPRAATSARRS